MPTSTRPLACLALLAAAAAAQAVREPVPGLVVGPDGAPIAGAEVTAWRAPGRELGLPDLEQQETFRRVDGTVTDARGRFAIQLPPGLLCRLVVDHPRFARWQRDDVVPQQDVTIRLVEPATYVCEVRNADGSGARASLRAWRPETQDEVFRGTTDQHGRFRFDRAEPGEVLVEFTPEASPSPEPQRVTLAAGREHVDEIRFAAGITLRGRVVDERGQPIGGARVGEGWSLHRAVTTDEEGRYTLHGLGSWQRSGVACSAPGFVGDLVEPRRGSEHITLDFRMRRGAAAAGRIVDEHGRALAGVRVCAVGLLPKRNGDLDLVATHSNTNGRFELRGLSPTAAHFVVLRQDGRATWTIATRRPDSGAVLQLGDIELPRARVLRGVLLDARGAPIAAANVHLRGIAAWRAPTDADGLPSGLSQLEALVSRRIVRTDEQGRFAFGDLPPAEFELDATDGNGHSFGVSTHVVGGGDEGPPIRLQPR